MSDLRDPRPLSVQLAAQLRTLITREQLKPGERLPTEHELAARFGVARSSVREALKVLEQDGLVDVRHGSGRFVSAHGDVAVHRPVTMFESVTEMLGARGYAPVNEVLSAVRCPPTAEEATALGLPEVDGRGSEVVRLRRLRLHAGELLIHSVNTFAANLLADGEELDPAAFTGSLATWLGDRGRSPVSSLAELEATRLPDDVAHRPEARGHRDWLLITERCVDAAGRPVLFSRDYHRSDVFSFHVLRRSDA